MTILATLASGAGVFMGLSSLPQIYKIFHKKNASGVSRTTHYIIVLGAIIWTLYGIEISSWPLIISNLTGVITNLVILLGCYIYKN